MKETTVKIGKFGEKTTTDWLVSIGYLILHNNYRFGKNEIDIIAKHNETLIFIEVKYRKNTKYGYPEDFVSDQQIERIQSAAEEYMMEHNWDGAIRFDIIAICKNEIVHIADAF